MTEAEWLAGIHPMPMLEHLRGKASGRKLLLLGVACCRRIWHLLTNDFSRRKVALMEQRADREIGETEEWMTVVGGARWVAIGPNEWAYSRENVAKWEQAEGSGTPAAKAADFLEWSEDSPAVVVELTVMAEWENSGSSSASFREANIRICDLIRDIFGNPFRPLPPRPEAIAPLAEQIYAGAWDQMPLLGEWLQEHGYWSEGEHCLDPNNQHVKGCWVVDWVTGRE